MAKCNLCQLQDYDNTGYCHEHFIEILINLNELRSTPGNPFLSDKRGAGHYDTARTAGPEVRRYALAVAQ